MTKQKIRNPWRTLSKSQVYENPWIQVEEHRVINPAGGKGIYGKVHFKNTAIGIIPLDEKLNTWLVGQYRYTLNEWSWEIPEGGGPPDKSVLSSAKRELREETGLIAKRWTRIAKTHLSNSVSDEVGYVFLAQGISQGKKELEATEADMVTRKLPFKKVLAMARSGSITDALSLVAIFSVARVLKL